MAMDPILFVTAPGLLVSLLIIQISLKEHIKLKRGLTDTAHLPEEAA